MGYQESFITTKNKKNFNNYVSRVKYLGYEYYDYYSAYPCLVVYVKQNIYHEYSDKIALKKNKSYLYFCGERYLQRDINRILNIDDYSKNTVWNKDKKFKKKRIPNPKNQADYPFHLDIIFSEEIDVAKILDTTKNKIGAIYPGLDNEYIMVNEFEF